ncbi:MAG: site-specific integrase [Candidatus Riflebacteria bacterium]|nr:site-specific integrase [Candidatus Riflebacteria bacterium]
MSSIYQRNDTWYIQYLSNGKLIQKSLKTKDKRSAALQQKQLDAQITLGQINITKGKIPVKATFAKLLEIRRPSLRPSSFTRYKGLAANLVAFLESISREYMNDLTDTDIARYVTFRREKGASNKTIFEELLIMKYAVKMLIEHDHLIKSPVKRWPTVKVTSKKPESIGGYAQDEIRKILAHFAGNPIYDYFMGLIYTGCRRSELWAITIADIDFHNGAIRISSMKTGTNPTNQFRHIEIHRDLLPILRRRAEGKRQSDAIFPIQGKGLWLLRALRKACKDLGIQYRRLHGLRHTFISTLLNVGTPLRAVMEMAGHSDFETTLRYSHISQNDMRGKINQLDFGGGAAAVNTGTARADAEDKPVIVAEPARKKRSRKASEEDA